ncbi:MAG: glycosyltransferase [Verrucomicrobia bacterium]|nr:glycosyltransferase [Verrucomicrobiota bacterium]
MKFSLCIPAYNEAALLPRLLDSVAVARDRYPGGADAIEVIVGDNRSTDATAAIAAARGCTVVPVEKRAIAAARNGAGRAARGEYVCFIDADSIVHPDTFAQIEAVMKTGRCVVGATGVHMERMSAGIWATLMIMLPLSYLFGMDTGVVFCRRNDFLAVGGYREELLAAEDVDFLFRLKRLGRSRGQDFRRTRHARAITSTRKFDRHGDWHYLTQMSTLPFRMLFAKASAERSIRGYWYDDRA